MFNWVVKMPLKSKINSPEQNNSHCSGAFIVDLAYFTHGFNIHISHISHINTSLNEGGWQGFQK